MFKLINSNDSKVFSSSLFIKNADFFNDEIAFFDAYSKLCSQNKNDIPNYCVYQNGMLCLEGVCLFFKSYATEFGFKTLDLTIDYLKTLYYAIAALSKNGEFVDRSILINEYLIYKDVNQKHLSQISEKWKTIEENHSKNLSSFESKNNNQAKFFVWSKVLNVSAILIMILAFVFAVFPVALYFSKKIILKSMIVYVVGIFLIGFILRIEFKFFSKHFSEISMEDAYSLQILKKNKNSSQTILSDIKIKNSKLICEKYEYDKGFKENLYNKKLSFEEILERAKKHGFVSFNIKNDVLNLDNDRQHQIYEILDKISCIENGNDARFENIYKEIERSDYLYFNNLVRVGFLNKFIENASYSKNWKIGEGYSKVDPFGVDVKQLKSETIIYIESEEKPELKTNLDLFFQTKYSKSLKNLIIRNVRDENSLNVVKMEYINHFFDLESDEKKSKIPLIIDLKLQILKNRLIYNTLGKETFEKVKQIISNYENNNTDKKANVINFLSERNEQNIKLINLLFECDEVKELDNDEVMCVVGNQTFRGVKLSNI